MGVVVISLDVNTSSSIPLISRGDDGRHRHTHTPAGAAAAVIDVLPIELC